MQEPTPPQSRAPRDLGLGGLGLIMQYGSSMMLLFTFGVLASLAVTFMGIERAFESFVTVVVALIVGLTRSGLGFAAGVKLTSGGCGAAKSRGHLGRGALDCRSRAASAASTGSGEVQGGCGAL